MNIDFPSQIVKGILSGPKDKKQKYLKGKIQRIRIKDGEYLQLSLFTDKQVFHTNLKDEEVNDKLNELLLDVFNNLELDTKEYKYGYRITNKGKVLSNKKRISQEFVVLEHNKKKKYLLEEGVAVPALIDLGVMTEDGKVVKAHYDKYKQINRFLEIIDNSISDEKQLKIIDFGCGKSYLTFILYYYLTEIKHINCEIIGLDLKEEVIDNCNKIKEKYGYKHLKFIKGDISKFNQNDHVDMIVTLHACDTATDYALYYAILMQCRYIFSVPCCQHEINQQLKEDSFAVFTQYGILKERFSAMITDAIRANILKYCGYKTQVMEFIDFENSPKNLLIRAVYTNKKEDNQEIKKEIDETISKLNVKQTLYELVFNKK